MRAAVLHGARDLRFEQVADPVPKPDEAVVRIAVNGICGSDIHFYDSGRLGPFVVDRPYVPGHEASGVVAEPARDGTGPKRGTRVAIEPGIPCRRCALCKSGRYNLCRDVVFLSAPPVNGTFAELAAVASDFLHPLPDRLSDEEGAFIEPLSVGVQACSRGGVSAGESVAILGAGPIGLVTMLVARAFGAVEIFLVDVLDNRLELATRLGASAVVNSRRSDVVEEIGRLTRGVGPDVVIDASGASAACAVAPELAARGGRVVLVGWPELSRLPWPAEIVIEKELDVRGVNRYGNTFPRAIGLLAAGRFDVKPLVSRRFAFTEVCEAFAFALGNRATSVKIMVA
jgi:L-iditol 2-dehydrogenase